MFPSKSRYPCILVTTFNATNNPIVMDCILGGIVPQAPKLSAHRWPNVAGVKMWRFSHTHDQEVCFPEGYNLLLDGMSIM
jgi:hypothetical protein